MKLYNDYYYNARSQQRGPHCSSAHVQMSEKQADALRVGAPSLKIGSGAQQNPYGGCGCVGWMFLGSSLGVPQKYEGSVGQVEEQEGSVELAEEQDPDNVEEEEPHTVEEEESHTVE